MKSIIDGDDDNVFHQQIFRRVAASIEKIKNKIKSLKLIHSQVSSVAIKGEGSAVNENHYRKLFR